jgi:hypothetical protein
MAWRELEYKQRDKTDHRLAFLISSMTSLCKMVAQSNGAKIRGGGTDPEKLYIPWGGEEQGMTEDKARNLFNAIASMAGSNK